MKTTAPPNAAIRSHQNAFSKASADVAPVGCAARVVMLHDRAGRLGVEEPQDVEGVVDVRQVDLAGVLAHLELVLFRDPAHEARIEIEEAHVAEDDVAVDQLVQGRRLVGVLAVADAPLDLRLLVRVVDAPYSSSGTRASARPCRS